MTSNLSLRERNQCSHRIEEVCKRIIEITEIIGQERFTFDFEGAGITLHVAAEIENSCP